MEWCLLTDLVWLVRLLAILIGEDFQRILDDNFLDIKRLVGPLYDGKLFIAGQQVMVLM